MKFHLKRVAGNAKLTYVELYTLLVPLWALLSSRALYSVTSHDLMTLISVQFLLGESLVSTVVPHITCLPHNTLSRWQYVDQLRQHFWNRWRNGYSSTLNPQTKWANKNFLKVKLCF